MIEPDLVTKIDAREPLMVSIRQPAVAGSFYPADAGELRQQIEQYLSAVQGGGSVPKAIIAPHAGYIYSGPVAASAYARLKPAANTISRVVLTGPSHRVGFSGIAVSSAHWFTTPLGDIPIDRDAVDSIVDLPFVHTLDKAHSAEHSLEVHLPFLQIVVEEFQLVPIVAGDASPEEIGILLDRLWGGPETLIVTSSDLSHYHDYETARKMDSETSEAIEALHWEAIGYKSACGRIPINGLLYTARRRGLTGKTIDLRNSGDTAGPRDQVVGYGAYVFN